jgi:hypothetical protein
MPANLVDKTCKSVDWFTPPEILEPVRALFGGRIDLDPCTTAENPTKALGWWTKEDDGLSRQWYPHTNIFVNSPYGRQLYDWIEKVVTEAQRGCRIALLVSASSRWDQAKWQRIYSPQLSTFVMPRGRVKFLNAKGEQMKSPPYPSVLYFYNARPVEVYNAFRELGTVVKQEVL